MSEREYERVLDDLTGLQARLRGEVLPEAVPRPVPIRPERVDVATNPDTIPTLRISGEGETVSVTHDDLTVFEDVPVSDHLSSVDATVIPMPARGDGRVSEIAERLARLEMELTEVLHGLEDAEELLGPLPAALPMEESTGDPLLDLQRLVARRLEADPEP